MAKINWRKVLDKGLANLGAGKAPFSHKDILNALDWKTCPIGSTFGPVGGVTSCLGAAFYNHLVLAYIGPSGEPFYDFDPAVEISNARKILDVLGI